MGHRSAHSHRSADLVQLLQLAQDRRVARGDGGGDRELKKLYQVSNTETLGAALTHELRERDRRRASGQALTPR